jgi:cytochrome c peroxidase
MKLKFLLILLIFISVSPISAVEKKEIDLIFKAKCMDCHSNETVLPWYASLPLVKGFIASEVKKGKAYFMLPGDFFAYEDLESLPKHVVKRLDYQIERDEMPPFLYRLGHWDRVITPKEKESILIFLRGLGSEKASSENVSKENF